MTESYSIKRCHTRIYFGGPNRISGIISAVENLEISFSSSILNLSEGGLQFNQKRSEYRGLQKGDTLILRRIIGLHELVSLADIPMQIMWLMDNEYLDHVVMGVAFTKLTDSQRRTLQSFVNAWLAAHRDNKGPQPD
jgi:c-di-GMP-binding flagellar brake protein YcgR